MLKKKEKPLCYNMPDYSNGQNVLLRRPEPGRPAKPLPKENIQVDTNAIADAVIKAMVAKMPSGVIGNINSGTREDFDNSESLKKLADAMTNKEGQESNLSGLGKTQETKKDKKETDKTIDILSNLE
jgi:hypothetical protein